MQKEQFRVNLYWKALKIPWYIYRTEPDFETGPDSFHEWPDYDRMISPDEPEMEPQNDFN